MSELNGERAHSASRIDSQLPKLSVITICLNDPLGVQKTIDSVTKQDYPNLEYVLIDGASRKETLEVLERNRHCFDRFLSEPDGGIYDAMNKGLRSASGEWYIMMNAGDVFSSSSVVSECMKKILQYGTATWAGGGSRINFGSTYRDYFANPERGVFHHQSLFIKKALHKKYGLYVDSRSSNAWDFFFFNLLDNEKFLKLDSLVSVCDGQGVSSSVKNYLHVSAMAFLFGRQGRLETALKMLLYPAYRSFRNLFRYAAVSKNKN
jgi:glycosyltransferase involved in cell wall biosynthesis